MTKIITHPGQAHLDDFIAISLIIAHDEWVTEVHRRDPTQEELEDPETWVVDVGMIYDPRNRNFDHHQEHDPYLPEGLSSASLVARHLELDTSFFPWWEGVDRMDCTGPFRTAEWVGTTWDRLRRVSSPINGFVLQTFATSKGIIGEEHPTLTPGDWVWDLMEGFGTSLIEKALWWTARLDELDRLAQVTELAGHKWIIMLDKSGPPGLEEWCIRNHPDAVGTITLDDRGPGLCLYRRNDHPAIDFTRCKDMDPTKVEFIHKNGFVIKLTERDMSVAAEAIAQATQEA